MKSVEHWSSVLALITNRYIRTHRLQRSISLTGLAFLWLGIASCLQKPWLQDTLAEYQSRLATILETDAPLLPHFNPSFNAVSSANTPSPQNKEFNIKLREFYNLPECGIKPIIAERNTTLGKLQAPSQRYLYEIRLLRTLYQCLQMQDDIQRQQLMSIMNHKEQLLQESWRHLLLASDELKTARFQKAVHFDDSEDHRSAIQNWQSLSGYSPDKLKTNNYWLADNESLETILRSIAEFKTPAKLRSDMQLVLNTLPIVTEYLQNHLPQLECRTKSGDKRKAEYLRNVFNLFFIKKVQPLVGKINAWYFQLSPIFAQLGYNESNGLLLTSQLHSAFIAAVKSHVAQWQVFFKACDISPAI